MITPAALGRRLQFSDGDELGYQASQDIGHADSCHSPASSVLVPGGVTLSINPEARVYASLHQPRVHRVPAGVSYSIPVAIQNLAGATAPIQVDVIEPKGPDLTVAWDARPLTGDGEEFRTLQVSSRLSGFVELTLSFCLPYELPDLGARDRVRLILHVSLPTPDSCAHNCH